MSETKMSLSEAMILGSMLKPQAPRVQNPAVVRKDAAPKGGENQLGQSDDPLHITEAEALKSLAPEWPDVAEIAR